MLGITADELCTVYRTQFAVLYGYDHDVYFYDANGRLVPNPVLTAWRRKGEAITGAERTIPTRPAIPTSTNSPSAPSTAKPTCAPPTPSSRRRMRERE